LTCEEVPEGMQFVLFGIIKAAFFA
jgi:hypothetical protein